MKRNRKKTFICISIFVLALLGLGLFIQANSIAVMVNKKGSHTTVESAFDACNAQRTEFRAQGQDCEPCRLTCPKNVVEQSNDLYTFSYIKNSPIYEGTFKDLDCDSIGEEVGRLLEVKSFCNDNIRVCEEQDGTGTIIEKEPAEHGTYRKIRYKVSYVNCETGKSMGESVPYVKWQIVCDDGWVVNGNRVKEYKSMLGYCEPKDTDQKVFKLSGQFIKVHIDNRAATNQEIVAKGTFRPNKAGKYYIYATGKPKSQALSVVSKFGSYDLCGSDKQTAGVFFDLKETDTALFELSIPAPDKTGTYRVHVGARDGCYRDDMDSEHEDVEVYTKETLEDKVIVELITADPSALALVKKNITGLLDLLSHLDSCTGDEDFSVEGCVIAECIDGEVFLLSEEAIQETCSDPEVAETIKVAKAEYAELESFTVGRIAAVAAAVAVLGISGFFMFRKTKKKRRRGR